MSLNNKKRIFFTALIISAVTICVYLPALNNEFVNWDDDAFILENTHIRSLDLKFIKWSFTTFHTADWFPLTWISHALDYALWELNPAGHHLTNILLHGMNTFLVIILITTLVHLAITTPPKESTNSTDPQYQYHTNDYMTQNTALITGAITGILFGLHPIHVESVAWASERKDVLYSFFSLLSMISYLKYTSREITSQRKKYYVMTLLFFIFSLMSKAMAVTLPVILIIIDLYPLQRINFRTMFTSHRAVLWEKLPFLLLSIFLAIVTIIANREEGATQQIVSQQWGSQILVAFKGLCFYLYKMLWPTDLAPFYPFPEEISFFQFEFAGSVIIVAGITFYCLFKWKKQKVWLALWTYYVIILLPVIGLIQSGIQSAADRYAYLSSLGPFLLVALGATFLSGKIIRKKSGARYNILFSLSSLLLAVMVVLSFLTIKQIHTWKDSRTLWSRELKLYPNSSLAHFSIGDAYMDTGFIEDATHEFEISVKLEPNWERSRYNLGKAYYDQGLIEKAIHQYEIAVQLKPDFIQAHNNLGGAYASLGRLDKAIAHFKISIQLDPRSSNAYHNLGYAYFSKGLLDQAIDNFRIALQINPGHPKALQTLRLATAMKAYSGNQKR